MSIGPSCHPLSACRVMAHIMSRRHSSMHCASHRYASLCKFAFVGCSPIYQSGAYHVGTSEQDGLTLPAMFYTLRRLLQQRGISGEMLDKSSQFCTDICEACVSGRASGVCGAGSIERGHTHDRIQGNRLLRGRPVWSAAVAHWPTAARQ